MEFFFFFSFFFLKALLQSEVMTAYRIKDRWIINTLVWFLHPYSLNMITAYCYRQHHIMASLRGGTGICIMFIETARKWWLRRGRMLSNASRHHSPSIFSFPFIIFRCSSVLTLLALAVKSAWSWVSCLLQHVYLAVIIKGWIIPACTFIFPFKLLDPGQGWRNAWICCCCVL